MMNNIGWLYYRDYFDFNKLNVEKQEAVHEAQRNDRGFNEKKKKKLEETVEESFFNNKNQRILNQTSATGFSDYLLLENRQILPLKIENNGLVTGVGIGHEAGNLGELKLGFSFDYTTGLPIIYGSSVKGTLRSVFPNRLRLQAKDAKDKELRLKLLRKADKKEKYCIALFRSKGINITKDQLLIFEWIVFSGSIPKSISWNNEGIPVIAEESPVSTYESDIFHDAFISNNHRADNKFLGNDFITPHKNFKTQDSTYDALVDPTPLQFLKILPEVTFTFQFDLKASTIDNTLLIIVEKKIEIFKEILLQQGIGAKTNVGYGQLKTL